MHSGDYKIFHTKYVTTDDKKCYISTVYIFFLHIQLSSNVMIITKIKPSHYSPGQARWASGG